MQSLTLLARPVSSQGTLDPLEQLTKRGVVLAAWYETDSGSQLTEDLSYCVMCLDIAGCLERFIRRSELDENVGIT